MGVVVSDMTSEIRMDTVNVMENSRNNRPMMPPNSRKE